MSVEEEGGAANEGSLEESVGVGDLGEDGEWVGLSGDAVVGEAMKEMGDEGVVVVKSRRRQWLWASRRWEGLVATLRELESGVVRKGEREEKSTAMKSEMREVAMGILEVAGFGNGIEGDNNQGPESRVREKSRKEMRRRGYYGEGRDRGGGCLEVEGFSGSMKSDG